MNELSASDLLPVIPSFTDLGEDDISLASFQQRAQSAIKELALTPKSNPILLLGADDTVDIKDALYNLLIKVEKADRTMYDICYAENLTNPQSPTCLHIKSGTEEEFSKLIVDLLTKLQHNLDAEEVLLRILRKQDNDPKLENYLSELSAHVAQKQDFSHPVLMNLLVTHQAGAAPVIFGRDLTWKKLFGGVNYLTENGTTYSNHHLLEAGLLREADGGFLVLPVDDLLRNPTLWFKLKNTMQQGYLDWESPLDNQVSIVPFFSPEPTPINVRLIIIGPYYKIADLVYLDPSALDLIYLRTDFASTFKAEQYAQQFGLYIKNKAKKLDLLPLSPEAIGALYRFSCRMAESQIEFAINEHKLSCLLYEASGIAKRNEQTEIDLATINTAITADTFRQNMAEEEATDFYRNKQILLTTKGQVVGQINGLTVVHTYGDNFEYGEPVRITATIRYGGEGDISDIEHKANLAGEIHTKAMMIINGYLTNKFALVETLPVSANLVFEQSYSEIDGDSASLTGLCAILSAMALTPINQQYAVTGAVDQFGNVQAVGGLNEKIEGFYRVCKLQGLTGNQGVIIPASNQQSLILNDEVIDAVQKKQFHIFTVKTVDEAIEILTGVKAGLANSESKLNKDNKNDKTIYNSIVETLDTIAGRNNNQGCFWKRWFGLEG